MKTFEDLTPFEQCVEEIVADGYPRIEVEEIVMSFLHGLKGRLRKVGDEVVVPRFGTFSVQEFLHADGGRRFEVWFEREGAWWFKREEEKR